LSASAVCFLDRITKIYVQGVFVSSAQQFKSLRAPLWFSDLSDASALRSRIFVFQLKECLVLGASGGVEFDSFVFAELVAVSVIGNPLKWWDSGMHTLSGAGLKSGHHH